jgi:hypothetical protein
MQPTTRDFVAAGALALALLVFAALLVLAGLPAA